MKKSEGWSGFFVRTGAVNYKRTLIFATKKTEKISVDIVGKGFGASLEVAIVSKAKHDVVWAGSGEFKRGGIFGAGGTDNKKAAEELIHLAFQKF